MPVSGKKKGAPRRPGAWRPLHEVTYERIRDALMSGRFPAGQRISLRELTQFVGGTRAPVREAIRRLIAEGALEMRSPRFLRIPELNATNLLELRDLRVALEGLAVESAVRRATAEQAAGLRKLNAGIGAARKRGDVEADMRQVREFHEMIYLIAEMPRVARMLDALWTLTGPYMTLLWPDQVAQGFGATQRLKIIQAFDARDPTAARAALQSDIASAFAYLVSLADRHGRVSFRCKDARPAPRRRAR
jgi:GntR family colanic acid and biofilm gene transcriptional regulator